MKKIFLIMFFVVFSTSLWAKQVIKLKPGSNIDISPNTDTTIICEGETGKPTLSSYCKCIWGPLPTDSNIIQKGYALYKVIVMADGKRLEDYIMGFETDKKACEAAALNHRACL